MVYTLAYRVSEGIATFIEGDILVREKAWSLRVPRPGACTIPMLGVAYVS